MPDANAQVQVEVNGKNNTKGMFQQLGASVQSLEKNFGSLTSAMTKLGLAGAGIYAGMQIARAGLNFLKEGFEAAIEASTANRLLGYQIVALGGNIEATKAKADEFINSMVKLGQDDAVTEKGLAQLTRVTKNYNDAQILSKIASDLAASGIHTYSENVDMLQRIILGKGIRALTEYGIYMKDNATVGEQLAKVNGLITRSQEQMANDTDGQILRMRTSWTQFKENVGYIGVWFAEKFASVFNGVLDNLATNSESWSKAVSKDLDVLGLALKNPAKTLATALGSQSKSLDEFKLQMADADQKAENHWEAITGNSLAEKLMTADGKTALDDLSAGIKNLATGTDDAAKKIVKDFETIAKAITDSVNSQEKDIDDLLSKLNDLDASLQDDLTKAKEAYQKQTENLVRSTNDKLQSVYQQIGGETDPGRLKELQDEASKLRKILDEARAVVDVTGTLMKDDFQTLTSEYEKNVAKIKADNWTETQKVGLQMNQDVRNLDSLQALAANPANYGGDVNKVLAQIGIAGGNNGSQFIFNFNGDITDKAEFIKQIKAFFSDTFNLNRQVAK